MPGDRVQTLDLPKVEFYMDPYIPKDAIVFTHGKFGTYKTPILSNIAKAVALGEEEIFGCSLAKARVLFIQADTPKQVIVPRMKQLGVAIPGLDFNFCYPGFNILEPFKDGKDSLDSFYYTLLYEKHRQEGYELIFLDSLRAIHGEDDKESTTPHRVYRALRRLFPGATVVIIHHDTKDNPDKADEETFSGSQAWLNHATVGLKFKHKDKKRLEITLVHTKSQASELVGPLHIGIQEGILARSLAEARVGEVEDYIHSLLQENPGLGGREIDEKVSDYFGIGSRTARRRRLAGSVGQRVV